MSSDKIWWYAKGDQRQGPYTAGELKAFVASGQIAATDMVWKEGLANWVPASSVAGLFPSGSTGAPPPLLATQVDPNRATHAPKRKMHWALKTMLWVVGALVGLIVLAAIFGPDDTKSPSSTQVASNSSNESKRTSTPASAPVAPALRVGDTFETPTFQMQIVSAQLRQSVGDSMFASKASQGGIYLAIQWSYKNISKKPVSSFDLPTLHLTAPDGTKYDPDLGASASYATELNTNAKVLSDLNPGIQVTDANVFEVSQEQFNPASWKIFVDADTPVSVAFRTPQADSAPGAVGDVQQAPADIAESAGINVDDAPSSTATPGPASAGTEAVADTPSPSFDCARASTEVEHLICANGQLARLDVQLARAYKLAISTTSDKDVVQAAQRSWQKDVRNLCTDIPCIESAYKSRLAELSRSDEQSPPN